MSRDPRFATGPTLLDDIADLRRRIQLLEANRGGFVASSGGFTKASVQVVSHAGQSATDYACAAASGVFETDTSLTVTFTPAVVSTVVVMSSTMFDSDTVRALSCQYRILLDAATTDGTTRTFGAPVASSRVTCTVLATFASVSAASHTVKLEIARANSADTLTNRWRFITVLVLPE